MRSADTAGVFTFGVPQGRYDLPHPRLGLPVILLIHRVFLRAFELLREREFNLATATEDEITAALRSTIENDLRQTGEVTGFSRRSFDTVSRHAQFANCDGTRLAKSPDLIFKLRDHESEPHPVLSEFDGLFIEAKPVDSTHPVGSKYCDDGLIRFVRGDYAWAMQEAMMLAYTRDGRTIAKHLIPEMSKQRRMSSLATIQSPKVCHSSEACADAEAVYSSQHRRDFAWPNGKGRATDITVYHLWHRCTD